MRVEVFALGRSQGRVAFLPFTKVNRKACAERAMAPPVTIGEHIRAIRSERKLLQRDVAAQMGIAPETISCWEKSVTTPAVGLMPAIIHFLGYDPTPEPTTLPERMRDYRRKNGLTIKEAAHRMGVDESSWGQWERTGMIPWRRYRKLVDEFLAHGEAEDDSSRNRPEYLRK